MIFDRQNLFSDDQAVAASAPSSNVVDLGVPGRPHGGAAPLARDLGRSEVPLAVLVTEDFASLTSLTVTLEGADDAGFSAPVTLLQSAAVPAAELKAGYRFALDRLPAGTSRRYLRLSYAVAGSAATAGRITAGLVAALQQNP